VLRTRERTPTPYPFVVFTFGLAVESIKEFGGASLDEKIGKKNIKHLIQYSILNYIY
jgi:hypothetical protein